METAGLDGLLLAGRGILASYGYVVYAAGYTPLLRHSYVYLDADSEPGVLGALVEATPRSCGNMP